MVARKPPPPGRRAGAGSGCDLRLAGLARASRRAGGRGLAPLRGSRQGHRAAQARRRHADGRAPGAGLCRYPVCRRRGAETGADRRSAEQVRRGAQASGLGRGARQRSGAAAAGALAAGADPVAAQQAARGAPAAPRRSRQLRRTLRRAARRHRAGHRRSRRRACGLRAGAQGAGQGRDDRARRLAAQAGRSRRRRAGDPVNSARRCGHWALLLLAAAALALAGCGSKGKAREPAKLTRLEHVEVRPEREWSRRIGDGSDGYWSGLRIALASDALFAASIDGRVYAVNPQNGDLIWRVNTKARVISGPTLDGDQLYVGTLDGEVIALARADGKIRWRAQAPSEALAPPVGNGQVVVAKAVDGREYGLNAGSGERLWSFDRNEPNLTLRGLSAPLILGDRVYIGLDNGKLEALSLDDGQPIWEQTISVPTGRVEIERLTDIDADLL